MPPPSARSSSAQPGGRALDLRRFDLRQRGHRLHRRDRLVAVARRRSRFGHAFFQRVPFTAVRALAEPLGVGAAAGGAGVDGLVACHRQRHCAGLYCPRRVLLARRRAAVASRPRAPRPTPSLLAPARIAPRAVLGAHADLGLHLARDPVPTGRSAAAQLGRLALSAGRRWCCSAWRSCVASAGAWSRAGMAWMLLAGVVQYSINYWGVYEAERHIPSGLVAVLFSLMVFGNALQRLVAVRATGDAALPGRSRLRRGRRGADLLARGGGHRRAAERGAGPRRRACWRW